VINLGDSLAWGLGLAVVFPLVSVALAEVSLRLRRSGHPAASPLDLIRNFLLPAIGIIVLLVRVVGWERTETSVRLVETLVWLFVINTALSFLNAFMFANARPNTWQARMPRLFLDMARVLIVLVCLAIVVSRVWGQDLGQLAAALGVGSLVLGLALQEPLGNLFSGIMLMMERPIGVGDWVKAGDSLGKVIETNWRSVHMETQDGDLVVMPNSVLAKERFVNYSRPTAVHTESVTLNFSDNDAPNRVKLALLEAARRTSGVEDCADLKVRLSDFCDSSIEYKVDLPLKDFGRIDDIMDEFRTLVWYAARRDGLSMPYPTQMHIVVPRSKLEAAERAPISAEALEVFSHLGIADAEGPRSVSRSSLKHYARGEQVVREGERLSGLHLIVRGRAVLTARHAGGHDVEIARLDAGDFFGEKSLLSGVPSDATVTALEDLELLVLESDVVQQLFERTPYLVQQIGEATEARRKALYQAKTGQRAV
jgi:small-conductance mechanosensitive channel